MAVEYGDADLKPRDLVVEGLGHEPLAQQFDTMLLRFDATSAVVTAPSSPQGATEVF